MFVAPLNLDLFFKKVFSNKRIAKKFLEDLLGITITEIKILSVENKMTDDAVTVKFDFRCKIHGHYVVIEMQQKYKIDVVKRFYLYHAVSTALQLETLKPIKMTKLNGETYMEKNYSGLEPVITLIWMVDDKLGFEEDYVAFTTLPETAKDFITNANLWEQPLENILEERKKALKILNNKTKGLDFFTQNRLIYILQKNIVKTQNSTLPYFKWFDFANISRNPDNKEEDFLKYKNDKDMAEVINRLRKDKLTSEEFKYVSDIHSYDIYLARIEQEHKETVAKKLANQKKRLEKIAFDHQLKLIEKAEQEKQKAEQEKQKAEQEKQKAEQEKQKAELLKIKLAKIMLFQGNTIEAIAETLEISIEDTTELIKRIQNKEL
jgi:hypothetical protein